MSTTAPTARADAAMSGFLATTGKVGPATMVAGLLLSLAGPGYLVFFSGLDVNIGRVLTAYVAVAAVFGILWIVEPITYFPVLGPSAMYQAFMIGNISTKLLPAAVVAQDSVNAKPGTPRGDLAAVMAICGAAAVHLTSLLVFVGIFGTMLVSAIPESVALVARTYVMPAVMGAVLVQTIAAFKQYRATVIAIAVAVLVVFGLLPAVPALAFYGTPLVVLLTIVLAWLFRSRHETVAENGAGPDIHY